MKSQTKQRIIKNSLSCGFVTFLVNTLFSFIRDIPFILILTNILPGFLFGAVLSKDNDDLPGWRRLLFICCSGGLFIFVAWLATDRHLSFQGQLSFVSASLIGAYGLLLLYHLLLGKGLILWKGFLFATLTGSASALFPAKAYYDNDFNSAVGSTWDTITLMSIFLIWQTLFGLTVAFSHPAAANRRRGVMSAD